MQTAFTPQLTKLRSIAPRRALCVTQAKDKSQNITDPQTVKERIEGAFKDPTFNQGKDVVKDKPLDFPQDPTTAEVLGPAQELINARSAMVGIVAAIIAEVATDRSTASQLFGSYDANGQMTQASSPAAIFLFATVVILITVATAAPNVFSGLQPKDAETGPFKKNREILNGRFAMLGFISLIVVEWFKGGPIF